MQPGGISSVTTGNRVDGARQDNDVGVHSGSATFVGDCNHVRATTRTCVGNAAPSTTGQR